MKKRGISLRLKHYFTIIAYFNFLIDLFHLHVPCFYRLVVHSTIFIVSSFSFTTSFLYFAFFFFLLLWYIISFTVCTFFQYFPFQFYSYKSLFAPVCLLASHLIYFLFNRYYIQKNWKCIPLFKKGNTKDITNYCPLCFEKALYIWLASYFTKLKLYTVF